MGKIVERILNADRVEDLIAVFGSFDENIRRIEDSFAVSIVNRGTELKITGDEEAAAAAKAAEPSSTDKLLMEILETLKKDRA